MRTSTRISLAIALAVFVTLAISGYEQLQREERELRTVAEQELLVLGTLLEIAVANAVRDGQLADVHETLDSLHRIDPALRVRATDTMGLSTLLSGVSEPSDASAAVREAEADSLPRAIEAVMAAQRAEMRALGPDGRAALLLVQPLRADSSPVPFGVLVITRSLRDLGRDLRVTQLALLVSLGVAGLAILWIGRVAGQHYVTRPLNALGAAMREVRGGEAAVRVTAHQHDEVGALAAEFNAMVAAVEEARRRLEEEIDARSALEHGLQHVDKLVTVGQLASGLAHEIGSPLQVLHGRATTLRDTPHESSEVQRQAAILVTQTERIIRIVEQLLSFGRRLPLTIDSHDLRRVVGAMVEFIEPTARRRGIAVTFDAEPDLPLVDVDADRIQQVTLNLLTNALRATSAGGSVRVTVRRAPQNGTDASTSATERQVQLEVSDTGYGIAPSVQSRLFEPFFTTAASEGGAGLGLAVARAIVLEHRGHIAVESVEAEGSRFVVTLPVRSSTIGGLREPAAPQRTLRESAAVSTARSVP